MKNDQYFEPGDKVMRVARSNPSAIIRPARLNPKDAEYGQVYCVDHCWRNLNGFNVISFVGFPAVFGPNGRQIGFVAANFRKVEEIKLCVNAAEMAKKGGSKEAVTQKV